MAVVPRNSDVSLYPRHPCRFYRNSSSKNVQGGQLFQYGHGCPWFYAAAMFLLCKNSRPRIDMDVNAEPPWMAVVPRDSDVLSFAQNSSSKNVQGSTFLDNFHPTDSFFAVMSFL